MSTLPSHSMTRVEPNEVEAAYDGLMKGSSSSAGDAERVRGTVSMRGVALGEISLVSRLLQSLDEAVGKSTETPILEYPKDVPIFSYSHESRLLTECYRFPLPDGTLADMLPCARGANCMGMNKDLEGHAASGGVVLRALMTPEELTCFEHTGKNPAAPRLCVLCARVYVCEAYFETQDNQYDKLIEGTCFNFYGNMRGCREGYKIEHTIPLGSGPRWNGLIAPIACNALNKMRLKKQEGVWTVDQSELAHVDLQDSMRGASADVRRFR